VGFSNGANIAASTLLLHPGLLVAALLFHPMVPLVPEPLPDLSGTAVFVGAGRADRVVPPADTERLVALLRRAGADVTLYRQPGGHSLSMGEVEAARLWLAEWID
jgi:predicted esterase